MKYIAFLRGINIGGHQVKMEQLRELFRKLGLTDVRSYIQSGNIFFETAETDRVRLTRKIEQHLRNRFELRSANLSADICGGRTRVIRQKEMIFI